ncbi:MAG: PEP-CTERM sorting domain-containing protein [Planctomycetota bacterium]
MKLSKNLCFAVALAAALAANQSRAVDVVGGQTNVILDTDTLAAAANLTLDAVGGATIVPGDLAAGAGETSAAFPIDAASTLTYTPGDFLNTFSAGGTIEHNGTVGFNTPDGDAANDATVGDFSIRFDATRIGGDRSGFFVQSTTGIVAPLFDIQVTNVIDLADALTIDGELLVSAEFGQFLFDNSFSSTNLVGADVGAAQVAATAIPEPGTLGLLAGLTACVLGRRRR